MIERVKDGSGICWRVRSAMTYAQAAGLLVAGQKLLTADTEVQPIVVDLAAVEHADSAGIAVLLDWLRQARQQGREMSVESPPVGLRSLVELYGIEELLGFV